MTKLERWNAAFAAMDEETLDDVLAFAESSAKARPARRPKKIYLASRGPGPGVGGAITLQLDVSHSVFTPTLVERVVKLK